MSGNLKIAVTSAFSWPYVRRGSRVAYELAVYLAGKGHEVHYIGSKPGSNSRIRRVDGLLVKYHRLYEYPLLNLAGIGKLDIFSASCLMSMLKDRYDIIQTIFAEDAFAASLNKSLRGTPFVHYLIDRCELLYLSKRLGRSMLSRALKRASRLAVMSRFVNRELQNCYGLDGEIIPGGVDTDQFTPCREKNLDRPRILCTASLTAPRKRVHLLVRAFDELVKTVPGAILQLSGHTNPAVTRAFLQSVDPSTRGSIQILGVGSRDDLPELYRQAAITVLPSVDEAFGLVILESLASGTPVVATRSGGIPDILNVPGVGVLFDPSDDPSGLSRAMMKGLKLAGEPEVGSRCRSHALGYSWQAIGPRFEAMYRDVIQ